MDKDFFINETSKYNSITENIPNKMLATRQFVASVNGGKNDKY